MITTKPTQAQLSAWTTTKIRTALKSINDSIEININAGTPDHLIDKLIDFRNEYIVAMRRRGASI